MMGWIVLGVLVALLAWLVATYNRLVSLRNKTREAWSGIDVQLQRRADLVPNLVETVKGYRIHEADVLTAVTEARAGLMRANTAEEAGKADGLLERALGRLFAVAEAYPELKANESFLALQRQLAELEEEVSFARRFHNALVERLNTAIERFPAVLVAGPLGFERATFFKADEADRAVPRVDLG